MTSTHSISINGTDVPVTSADDSFDLDVVLNATVFKDWAASVDPKLTVSSILIQSLDMFGKRVGFIKFKADVCDSDGRFVPGIVFMRGGAVGILVVLDCNGELYTLLTVQARFPTGKGNFVEIPAGMLDGDGHFAGVAAKEMEEETGIIMDVDQLQDMTALAFGDSMDKGVYTSPGGSDEFLRLFHFRQTIEPEELEELKGKLTGNLSEHEAITLHVLPLQEAWKELYDAKSLAALYLYDKLKDQLSN